MQPSKTNMDDATVAPQCLAQVSHEDVTDPEHLTPADPAQVTKYTHPNLAPLAPSVPPQLLGFVQLSG